MGKLKNKELLFDCNTALVHMEHNVMRAMAERNYTAEDVLECFVDRDVLDIIRAATPHAQSGFRVWEGQCNFAGGPHRITFSVDCAALGLLPPRDVSMIFADRLNPSAATDRIVASIKAAVAVRHEFDTLREVVSWLNFSGVSASWARYYIPSLGNLLPAHHQFHHCKTDAKIKHVYMPFRIATYFRRAPEIITRGLLCAQQETAGRVVCHLRIGGDPAMVRWLTIA